MDKNFTIADNMAINETENYIIYYDGCFRGTSLDNYRARIMNARAISKFDGFTCFQECIDYYDKHFRR